MKINVLCIGDIVGRPGKRVLANKLPTLVQQYNIDCVITDAENAAGGSGITPAIYDKLCKYGVNLITLGDHAYKKRDIIRVLETADNIIRPANMSSFAAGRDFAVYKTAKGTTVGVVSVLGRIYMKPADNPYEKIDLLLPRMQHQAEIIFVEVHAEATSEKVAMGWYLDGRVSCVFGSHTHVPTADEKILPKGTAYITDIGMTGSHESVLGRKIESVLKNFRTQMPCPFEVATRDVRLNAIVVTVDSNTRQAERIERVQILEETEDDQGYDSDDGKPDYCGGF